MTQGPMIHQLEYGPEDFAIAEELARRLGYTQTAYTSSSALWGLFCLPDNPDRDRFAPASARQLPPFVGGCIIKTREFGLMFVQDLEDLHADDLRELERSAGAKGARP